MTQSVSEEESAVHDFAMAPFPLSIICYTVTYDAQCPWTLALYGSFKPWISVDINIWSAGNYGRMLMAALHDNSEAQ